MENKTSNPEKLYSWAINAVQREMEKHGFSVSFNDVPGNHTEMIFRNSQTRYSITLPYQPNHDELIVCEPFDLIPPAGAKVDNAWRELARITLLNITANEKEVKDFIARRIEKLFGKRSNAAS